MRQPVKGKPHISAVWVKAGKFGPVTHYNRPHSGFHRDAIVALDRWEDGVRASWNRWWRQHQEAA